MKQASKIKITKVRTISFFMCARYNSFESSIFIIGILFALYVAIGIRIECDKKMHSHAIQGTQRALNRHTQLIFGPIVIHFTLLLIRPSPPPPLPCSIFHFILNIVLVMP